MRKNKKNFKKLNKSSQIGTTPVKAEEAKKEESIASKNADKGAKAAANHAAKIEKKANKKAISDARKKARNKRKEELKGIKHVKATITDKVLTIEDRKIRQENRRKIAYDRHIAAIRRRCKRMKLDENTTNKVIEIAKKQWDSAKTFNIVMVYEITADKRKELNTLFKGTNAIPHMTNSTAFINNLSKENVDKLRELCPDATIYQYRTDENPFTTAGVKEPEKKKTPKVGGPAHSIACTKNRNKNFYLMRRAKKLAIKPVNTKPTQIKDVHSKTTKLAA